jgi:hypothetical protein
MTMMSSEACDPPVRAYGSLKTELIVLVTIVRCLRPPCLLSECNKDIVIKLNLCTFFE